MRNRHSSRTFCLSGLVFAAVMYSDGLSAEIQCQPDGDELVSFLLRPNGVPAKALTIRWRGKSRLWCSGDELNKLIVQEQFIDFKVPASDLVSSDTGSNDPAELDIRISDSFEASTKLRRHIKIDFQPILSSPSPGSIVEFELLFEDIGQPNQDDIGRIQKAHDRENRIYRSFFMGMQMAESNNYNVRLAGLFFQAIAARGIERLNRRTIGVAPGVVARIGFALEHIKNRSDANLVRAYENYPFMYGSISDMYRRVELTAE